MRPVTVNSKFVYILPFWLYKLQHVDMHTLNNIFFNLSSSPIFSQLMNTSEV